jgi:hypothetical protein
MNLEIRLIERLALSCVRGSRQEYFVKALLEGPVEVRYQKIGWPNYGPVNVVTNRNYALGQFQELRKRMRELGFTMPRKDNHLTLAYNDKEINYRYEFDGTLK